jgi:hypothetical protein
MKQGYNPLPCIPHADLIPLFKQSVIFITMEIYTLYFGDKGKGDGVSFSCTNKRVLADRTGIGYDKLVNIFTRQKKLFFEDPENNFIIIHSTLLHRGGQRIKVKRYSTAYNRNL